MTQANPKKLNVSINETNDTTPQKVRRLVNRCCWEKKLLKLFQGWGWEIDVEKKAVDTNTKGFLCTCQQKGNKIVVGPCFSPGLYWVKYYYETKGVVLIAS